MEVIQRAKGRDKGGKPLYVVNPHALRHFHAVRTLGLGIPLNDLPAQLGHTDLKTTSVYSRPTSTTGGRATRGSNLKDTKPDNSELY